MLGLALFTAIGWSTSDSHSYLGNAISNYKGFRQQSDSSKCIHYACAHSITLVKEAIFFLLNLFNSQEEHWLKIHPTSYWLILECLNPYCTVEVWSSYSYLCYQESLICLHENGDTIHQTTLHPDSRIFPEKQVCKRFHAPDYESNSIHGRKCRTSELEEIAKGA